MYVRRLGYINLEYGRVRDSYLQWKNESFQIMVTKKREQKKPTEGDEIHQI
jgi:hypothetical protein